MADFELDAQQRALAAEVVSGTLTLEQAADRAGVPNSVVARWVSQLIFASAPSLENRARTLITFSQPPTEAVKASEPTLAAAPTSAESAPTETGEGLDVAYASERATLADEDVNDAEDANDYTGTDSSDQITDDFEDVPEYAITDAGERDSLYERPTIPRARPAIDEQTYSLTALTTEQAASLSDIDPRLLTALDGTQTVGQVIDRLDLDPYEAREHVQRLLTQGYLLPSSLKPTVVSVASSEPTPQSNISIPPFKPQRSRLAWTATAIVLSAAATAGYRYKAELLTFARLAPAEQPATYAAQPLDPPKTTVVEVIPAAVAAQAKVEAKPASCPEGMVFIPAGQFTMGSNDDVSPHATPAHDVTFSQGFCMDRVEVTVADYRACVASKKCTEASAIAHWGRGNTKSEVWAASRRLHSQQCNTGRAERGDHPINCISWSQANGYCEAQGYHLPTEAQWEYAARGTAGRSYPWGNQAPGVNTLNGCGKECDAWHTSVGLHNEVPQVLHADDDTFVGTAPVGSFPAGANPEGVLDLAGNVAEWTANSFYEYSEVVKSPTFERPQAGAYHVVRGGGFNSTTSTHVHAAARIAVPNATFSHAIGFRCVSDSLP